jgi:MFS family permease
VLVAVAFVTMAIGVNARTAFSFGFLVSAALSPLVGRLMDRRGPRVVIEMGVVGLAAGLMLAPLVDRPMDSTRDRERTRTA